MTCRKQPYTQNETSGSLTEPQYLESRLKREQAIRALDALFERHQVDALLCTRCEIVAPITGFPSMSIPIGSHENRMPIGVYWIAERYGEATLLRIAYAAEALLGVSKAVRRQMRPDVAHIGKPIEGLSALWNDLSDTSREET